MNATNFYEVTIHGARQGLESTLQVQAGSWRQAWATAAAQVGAAPEFKGLYVDLSDSGVRVNDPRARRSFRIRQLGENEIQESAVLRHLSQKLQAVAPPSSASGSHKPLGFKDKATGAFRGISAADIAAFRNTGSSDTVGRVLQETSRPAPQPDAPPLAEPISDSAALEDVFLETPRMFDENMDLEVAIDFIADLAFRYLPSEHLAVLFSSDNADHLYAATARGPKQSAIEKANFSIEKGLPAASLQTGISIAVVNPPNDPRYHNDFALAGLQETNIVCAPIQSGERGFGTLVLLNRRDRAFYADSDVQVATYIGSQLGRFIQQMLEGQPD